MKVLKILLVLMVRLIMRIILWVLLMMMVRKMKMILLVGASRMKEDEVLRIINSGRRSTRPDTFEMWMIFSPVPINNHSLLFYARKLM